MRVSREVIGSSKLLAALLAVAVAFLVGCGGRSETPSAKGETTTAQEETTAVDAEEEIPLSEEEFYGAGIHQGCPERSRPLRDLYVGLDEWNSPEIAGVLTATERGYFAESGLEVYAPVAVGPVAVIEYVVEGVDDIGVSHEPEAMLAKEEGAPIVILGSLIPQPTAAIIWLKKSKIGSISDLKGKTIGIPGLPFQELFLKEALAKDGLAPGDVKIESMGRELVHELVNGHADAILGRSNLQGAELEARGLDPMITPIQHLGIPGYGELVLIAQVKCVSRRPRIFRDFLSALTQGNAAAVNNPKEVLRTLVAAEETNPETSRKALGAQLKATLPLISRSGDVSRAQARRLEHWMYEEGMIKRRVPLGPLLSSGL